MGKPKVLEPARNTMIRIPMTKYERLLKRAGERQSKERRPISVNSLINEAIDSYLAA